MTSGTVKARSMSNVDRRREAPHSRLGIQPPGLSLQLQYLLADQLLLFSSGLVVAQCVVAPWSVGAAWSASNVVVKSWEKSGDKYNNPIYLKPPKHMGQQKSPKYVSQPSVDI